MPDLTLEQRAEQIVDRWMDSPRLLTGLSNMISAALRAVEQRGIRKGLLRAADHHNSISAACDHERSNGDAGAGAMGAILEYRDLLRSLADQRVDTALQGEG